MRRWQWALRLVTRRMWFRASLFCLFAVLLVAASALVGHGISYDFATRIGSKSVDGILNLLAASMLTVTTFSLTAMVQAYWGANSTLTPRAVQLLIDDPKAQNALATFLGSFLFAIVGLIALSTGLYGDTGRTILFGGTILVVLTIVVTFLRWIEHISRFGQVAETIDWVEHSAICAVKEMTQRPRFADAPEAPMPDDAVTVMPRTFSRVTHVDLPQLGRVAERLGATIHVAALPGALVDPARPLAWTTVALDDDRIDDVRGAFTLGHYRAFDNDPRFGLIVLYEIASRALSPAVNDPGTAIATVEAGSRVIEAMLRLDPSVDQRCPDGVVMPAIPFAEVIEDLFRPVARDGAALIEVVIRVQKTLAALATIEALAAPACRAEAADALDRARAALTSPRDVATAERVHAQLWHD